MLAIRFARSRLKFNHLVMCSSEHFLCLSFRKQLSRKIPGPDLRDFCHRDMAAAGCGGAAMLRAHCTCCSNQVLAATRDSLEVKSRIIV